MPQGRPDAELSGAASERFRQLALADDDELGRLFRAGGGLQPEDVAGTTWRGWNHHPLFGLLRQRKFFKRFGPAGGRSSGEGENVLARQDGLDRPWRPRLGGRGLLPFAVLPPGAGPLPDAPAGALVISYGDWPRRAAVNPVGRIVDHLVRVPGSETLLLGRSLVRVPTLRGWFLEHFLLEA